MSSLMVFLSVRSRSGRTASICDLPLLLLSACLPIPADRSGVTGLTARGRRPPPSSPPSLQDRARCSAGCRAAPGPGHRQPRPRSCLRGRSKTASRTGPRRSRRRASRGRRRGSADPGPPLLRTSAELSAAARSANSTRRAIAGKLVSTSSGSPCIAMSVRILSTGRRRVAIRAASCSSCRRVRALGGQGDHDALSACHDGAKDVLLGTHVQVHEGVRDAARLAMARMLTGLKPSAEKSSSAASRMAAVLTSRPGLVRASVTSERANGLTTSDVDAPGGERRRGLQEIPANEVVAHTGFEPVLPP